MNRINLNDDIEDSSIYEIIDEEILEYTKDKIFSINKKNKLRREIFDSIRGLDILEEIISDADITEIMINGPDNIFYEKQGIICKYDGKFSSLERLEDVIQQIVSFVNRRVNESTPIVDSRLKDGSRVNVVLKPVAINGPILTIRRFPKERITIDKLIEINSITKEAAEFLRVLVVSGYNIFISGGTGSGKTTFLNALSNFIPNTERIITIEDSAELQLQNIENIVKLEAREANIEGENAVTIRDLIKSSLRMRPDRIVVGEVRGPEAIDMLQAMNTGHDGSLSTGHANSPRDMLSRLETMILMGMEIPISAVRSQIASGIDILVQLGRLRDRTRKVIEIVEIIGIQNDDFILNKLYEFDEEKGCENIKVNGKLTWTKNGLRNTQKLINNGLFKEAEIYGNNKI
ncbi:MAG: CpaF family protein [Lachnospiraceae bacterium]|nr:CpaF family protein [Lachnospiraceae bacterium]